MLHFAVAWLWDDIRRKFEVENILDFRFEETQFARAFLITEIYVGDCSDLVAERVFLIRSNTRLENDMSKLDERVSKLEIQKKALGFLAAEDEDFLQAALRIKEQKLEQQRPIINRITAIERVMAVAEEASFRTTRSLHAGVVLKIKGFRREIDAEYGRITAYANSLGIVIS